MIDENKLIEILSKNSIFEKITNADGKNIYEIIEEMPKTGDWIPCSETLPQRQDSKNTILKMYLVQGRFDRIYKGFRNENGVWMNEHGNIIKPVIAWMPLPEPYKEGVDYVRCKMDKN